MMDQTTTTTIGDALASLDVGYHLVSSDVVDLTTKVHGDFAALPSSPTERPVNRKHQKHLREKVEAGKAVTFHWVSAELEEPLKLRKGQLKGTAAMHVRVNGQHSNGALAEIMLANNGTLPAGLKCHREIYRCRDGDALALLHQQFDDKKSGRSSGDISAIYQGLQPDLDDVDHDTAKLALDGYVNYLRYVQGIPQTAGDAIYSLFNRTDLHPFIHWLAEIHSIKTPELRHKEVAAAMYGTFEANEGAARDFWDQVSRGGDPDRENSPITQLDRLLVKVHKSDERPENWNARSYIQASIYCWNAWREERTVQTVRYEVKKALFGIHE